jgi:pimeloyl-ACP methyl ester carboxylesterase
MHAVHPRRRGARWAAVVQVLVLAVAGLVATGTPATATVAPGTVLTLAPATLPAELTPLATGKRITYVTTTVTGGLTVSTGLVLTPKTGKKNRTVVWGHGTTGIADRCAPSVNHDVFWPEAKAAIAALLGKGWTVAAPDYPGLGTPGAHPYLIGASAARSMIDSVKAARILDPALSTQYVVDGHSQGGQGALFAGELASTYDGPLVLRGVAALAPASNLDVLAQGIAGTPGQGYLVMALYGLSAVDPSVNPDTLLAAPARQRTPVLQSGCLYQILAAYESLAPEELLVGGALPPSVIAKLGRYGNPGQTRSSAPILVVHGTEDEAVPYFVSAELLVPLLRTKAPSVDFITVPGGTHDGTVTVTAGQVATWIAARFS